MEDYTYHLGDTVDPGARRAHARGVPVDRQMPARRARSTRSSIGGQVRPRSTRVRRQAGAGRHRRSGRSGRPVPDDRERGRHRRAGGAAAEAACRARRLAAASGPADRGRGLADGRRSPPHGADDGLDMEALADFADIADVELVTIDARTARATSNASCAGTRRSTTSNGGHRRGHGAWTHHRRSATDGAPSTIPARSPARMVRVTGGFWADRLRTNRERTIPPVSSNWRSAGTLHNFKLAAGAAIGVRGPGAGIMFDKPFPFLDSDVYKWLEGAGWELGREWDGGDRRDGGRGHRPGDAAQRPDGYINSFVEVLAPGHRIQRPAVGPRAICSAISSRRRSPGTVRSATIVPPRR